MKHVKKRGITEIKVRLLPEKARRDYLLRLISSIIIMIFVILNFFLVFLPRRELIDSINSINRRINDLQTVYNNKLNNYNMNDNIYDINENSDLSKIDNHLIDTNKILATFSTLKTPHSFIETVRYDNDNLQFIIRVQFDTPLQLSTYQRRLESLDYVTEVVTSGYSSVPVSDGDPRHRISFKITLDIELAPKVGDSNE